MTELIFLVKMLFVMLSGLVVCSFFGYPASLWLISIFRNRPVKHAVIEPSVSLIITLHNEEKVAAEKLENTLAICYPKNLLQVIVASDGSTDATVDIVKSYVGSDVELIDLPEQRGKENAQKEAAERSRGEILVFTDAATRMDPDVVKKIVANFNDLEIGCVSSEDQVIRRASSEGAEGLYVKYEMWLRRLESKISSIIGVSGSLFAVRRCLFKSISSDIPSDFSIALECTRHGYRSIVDPAVVGQYAEVASSSREYERKVRTVLRGLVAFFRYTDLLNPRKYGLISFQLICHKLLRWLVPFFLLIMLILNGLLVGHGIVFDISIFGQMLFYGAGLATFLIKKENQHFIFRIPRYFIIAHAAIAVAWWRYLRGKRVLLWRPSERN